MSAGYASTGRVASMYHWITASILGLVNRLVFFEAPDKLRVRDLIGNATATFFTLAGAGASVAEAGGRLFIAIYTTGGGGAGECRIVNALLSGTPVDKAFTGPMTITPTVTDQGDGQVTEGEHLFGYILETRTGYTGRPGPTVGNVFTPVAFTAAAGGRKLRLEVNGTMPTDAAYLHPIMTRKDNPATFYFVPDAAVAVPPGVPYTAWMDVDYSDSNLASRAEEATDNFSLLSQVSGVGPITPSAVVALGRRMAYFYYNKVYVSDFDDFQSITEDRHVLQTAGQKQLVTGFQIRGVNYLFGPGWTFAVIDNDDFPRTWGQPHQVSDALGATGAHCVTAQTGGDYGFVANEQGFWLFNGQYADKPLSYYCEDWKQINWAASYSVKVIDFPKRQKVVVNAALGTDTTPTHRFVFDYSNGMTPETVNISIDYLGVGQFGTSAVIVDPSTGVSMEVVGPHAAGNFLKFDDEALDDAGGIIHSVWESSIIKGRRAARDYRYAGVWPSIRGEGKAIVTVFNQSRKENVQLEFPLEMNPDSDPLETFDFVAEAVTVRFETSELRHHFDLEDFDVYVKPETGAREN